MIRSGIKKANDIERLERFLGEICDRFGKNHMRMMEDCQRELWKAIHSLTILRLFHQATFSERAVERVWAINQISQIPPDTAIIFLQAIIDTPTIQKEDRDLSQRLLDKLNNNRMNS
jgi:hypothetical protein